MLYYYMISHTIWYFFSILKILNGGKNEQFIQSNLNLPHIYIHSYKYFSKNEDRQLSINYQVLINADDNTIRLINVIIIY